MDVVTTPEVDPLPQHHPRQEDAYNNHHRCHGSQYQAIVEIAVQHAIQWQNWQFQRQKPEISPKGREGRWQLKWVDGGDFRQDLRKSDQNLDTEDRQIHMDMLKTLDIQGKMY